VRSCAIIAQTLSFSLGTRKAPTPLSQALRYPCPPANTYTLAMPSFDVVSEVNTHELTNAVDQAGRELTTRFDFKGVDAKFVLDDNVINLSAPSDFQLKQMHDILRARLIARGIDVRCLEEGEVETNLAGARQKVTVKQGIEQKIAKKIAAALKDAKIKVDSQINGDKLRVNGKKRDDLQDAIALLKKSEFELPLQFDNFRD
jgi:cyclic-di-GMP-binding protein